MKDEKPYEIELYFGCLNTEGGKVEHTFEVTDPIQATDGCEMGERLARRLGTTAVNIEFDWNSVLINLPDSVVQRIKNDARQQEPNDVDKAPTGSTDHTIRMTQEIKISNSNIDDIIVKALTSGSRHWLGEIETTNKRIQYEPDLHLTRGGSLIIHDKEDKIIRELTLEKFICGLRMYLNKFALGKTGQAPVRDNRINMEYIGSNAADQILQFALFRQIIFN